jgi:hypothetical protein
MIRSNNMIIKTLRRILIFTILVYVLDFLVGSGLEYLYFKQKSGLFARTTFGLEKTKADLLIFGSSSAIHHYNPAIFENCLKLRAYNEGRDGIDILYHSAILKAILKRYSPKIIILNLSPYELSPVLGYDRLSALLPYYKKYPEMREVISLKSKFEEWKLLSKIYPYNSAFFTILNGIANNSLASDENGYVPLNKQIDTLNYKEEDFGFHHELDSNRVKSLNEFISDCKTKNIPVYLIFSPVYKFDGYETETTKAVMQIAVEKSVNYLNFMNDKRFKGHASLFQDNGHMNHEGATLFSEIVANQILNDYID